MVDKSSSGLLMNFFKNYAFIIEYMVFKWTPRVKTQQLWFVSSFQKTIPKFWWPYWGFWLQMVLKATHMNGEDINHEWIEWDVIDLGFYFLHVYINVEPCGFTMQIGEYWNVKLEATLEDMTILGMDYVVMYLNLFTLFEWEIAKAHLLKNEYEDWGESRLEERWMMIMLLRNDKWFKGVISKKTTEHWLGTNDHFGWMFLNYLHIPRSTLGWNHTNTSHNKCNQCFVFHI